MRIRYQVYKVPQETICVMAEQVHNLQNEFTFKPWNGVEKSRKTDDEY